ncbi:App1 family protein [Spirosoma sp.]|uniref:App1 family protein n=1 Tax=Spirosoma sp. TaxID=1899569 RepID=UPI003B3A1940
MEAVQSLSLYKQNKGLKDRLKQRLFKLLRLSEQPAIKLYRGFGNKNQLIIHGSAFQRSALPRKKYRTNALVNTLGLLRLFLVQPCIKATVRVSVNGQSAETTTDKNGYFRVEISLNNPLTAGWHPVRAELVSNRKQANGKVFEGTVLVPDTTPFACISDIDDTFLVSHSATITKRLKVLLTKNAHTRKPFEGVVAHYKLLAEANSGPGATNPFFYVSSSEWNLYDYILEFSRKNGLPDGVYLLSPLKQLNEVLKTGQNKHMTKFMRIVRILETYPDQQFILLGDDTQEDPTIYASVVEHFPKQIRCVYIRQVHGKNEPKTREILGRIEAQNVPCCYFAHSADARQHSIAIGLVAS